MAASAAAVTAVWALSGWSSTLWSTSYRTLRGPAGLRTPSGCNACQHLLVLDGPLDGLDGFLDVDEGLTHPFRLATLVCLRQCIRNVATLLYPHGPGPQSAFECAHFLEPCGHFLRALLCRCGPSLRLGNAPRLILLSKHCRAASGRARAAPSF